MKGSIVVKTWLDIPMIISEESGVKTSTALLLCGTKREPVHTLLRITENEAAFVGLMITYADRKISQTRYAWPSENSALETADRILRRRKGTSRAFLSRADFEEAGGAPAVRAAEEHQTGAPA